MKRNGAKKVSGASSSRSPSGTQRTSKTAGGKAEEGEGKEFVSAKPEAKPSQTGERKQPPGVFLFCICCIFGLIAGLPGIASAAKRLFPREDRTASQYLCCRRFLFISASVCCRSILSDSVRKRVWSRSLISKELSAARSLFGVSGLVGLFRLLVKKIALLRGVAKEGVGVVLRSLSSPFSSLSFIFSQTSRALTFNKR